MQIGAWMASPIGQLVPIAGTDWRTGASYQHLAYVPDPLPDAIALADRTWTAVRTADQKLARLDRAAGKPGRVTAPETVDSLSEPGAALEPAIRWARGAPLTVELVNQLHAALLRGTRGDSTEAGRLRRGNVFLGDRPGPVEQSRFVPTPHGPLLTGAFEQWIQWLNRTDSHLSPVVQAGLAHSQFETLHPYSDGNGRVGRLAIVLTLVRRGVLRYPTVAVSPWLADHRAEYQDRLLQLSRTGDWDAWLMFFATALGGAAELTQARLQRLLAERPQTARPPRRASRDRRPAGIAAGMLAALALAACGGSSSPSGVKGGSEVQAAPISSAGSNPFSPPLGTDKSGVTPPTAAASTSGGPARYVASLPGLYGGTRNYKSCDAEKLITFLQQNPAKARAWASTLGVSTSDIRSYVSGLTPVLLRTDTRVTNHGYVNGMADPIQSVLEAGTAVFLDKYGKPVVKCYCGNPLTPPELLSSPVYTGPLWASFTTVSITIIQPSPTIINTYTLYDPNTGSEFKRPAGIGGHDGPYVSGGSASQNPTPSTPAPTPAPAPKPAPTPAPTSTPAPKPSAPSENPSVSLSPNPVRAGDTVTLSASGYAPNVNLDIKVVRPDGVEQHFGTTADSSGAATYTFPNAGGSITGTYTVKVTDPKTGANASTTIDVTSG